MRNAFENLPLWLSTLADQLSHFPERLISVSGLHRWKTSLSRSWQHGRRLYLCTVSIMDDLVESARHTKQTLLVGSDESRSTIHWTFSGSGTGRSRRPATSTVQEPCDVVPKTPAKLCCRKCPVTGFLTSTARRSRTTSIWYRLKRLVCQRRLIQRT